MRLRVCIIVAAALGAAGSLILATDMYRRLLAAERLAADGLLGSAGSATLVFGMTHVLGTAAMGILFLAICLLLAGERKPEKKTSFVEKKSEPPPPPRAVSSASQPAVSPRVSSPSQPAVAPSSGPAQGVQAQTAPPKESPSGVNEAVPAIIAPFRPPTRVTRPEGPIPSPPPKQPSVIMAVPQFPPPSELPQAPPVPEHRPAKNIFIVQAPPAPPPSDEAAAREPHPVSETDYQRAVMERKVLDEQGDIQTATPLPDSGLHKGVGEEKPSPPKSEPA